jgi:purine nucleosidase
MTIGLAVAPHCRVIVDNDYQGDPDGLVALAHHLLSPANRVTAVTSSFLNTRFPVVSPRAEDGAVLASQLLEVVGDSSCVPVHTGSEIPSVTGAVRRPPPRSSARLAVMTTFRSMWPAVAR